jgi:hypothetical protein
MAQKVIVFKRVTSSSTVLKGLKLGFCGFTIVKLVMVAGTEVHSNN